MVYTWAVLKAVHSVAMRVDHSAGCSVESTASWSGVRRELKMAAEWEFRSVARMVARWVAQRAARKAALSVESLVALKADLKADLMGAHWVDKLAAHWAATMVDLLVVSSAEYWAG